MSVTIYGIPGSPYVRAALLGCEKKGVAYDFRRMGLGDTNQPEHLARHPFGRIPAFEHDGFALLRDAGDPPLYRRCVSRAGLAAVGPPRGGAGICDWYFFPQVTATICFQRLKKPMMGGSTDEDACAAALPDATRCIEAVAQLMGDGPYLAGEELSIADLMLAPHMAFFAMTPEGQTLLAGAPSISDWLARMDARPSMRNTDFFAAAKAA
jgi:glutathione S-transferase